MTKDKVSPEVRRRVTSGEKEVPVIVTVAPGTQRTDLEGHGLMHARQFESISAAAGTVTREGLGKLESSPEVDRIEYDGEMHAL
jgi:hypothetical protein